MPLFRDVVRPLLFRFDAEAVHHAAVAACRIAGAVPGIPAVAASCLTVSAPELAVDVAGLRFPNPIGLAAGWDKSGRAVPLLGNLGFGFVEVGSVSAEPSAGNPRPRLARLPADSAIVVNYGLPNDGADIVAARLDGVRRRLPGPLGVNLVATNRRPEAPPATVDAILDDYAAGAARLHRHADYLMLNLSCPNAADGKDVFARRGMIARLLERLAPLEIEAPVFLKVPPEESPVEQERWLSEVEGFPFVRGFSFNLPAGKPTTLDFVTPRADVEKHPGAVAGRPFAALSDRCIAGLYARMDRRRLAILGGGGVLTVEDAYRKVRLGASLVPIYTALVYEGPTIVRRLNAGLVQRLRRDGFPSLQAAVGTAE